MTRAPWRWLAAIGACVLMAGMVSAVQAAPIQQSSPLIQPAANAKLGTILTNANGRTLYYLTSEAGAHIVCSGACLSVWPPLMWPAGTATLTAAGFPGTFGTVTRPDGSMQVTYNSLPLYTFAKDSAPGDINGEGIKAQALGGVWHAVTPNLVPLAATLAVHATLHVTAFHAVG